MLHRFCFMVVHCLSINNFGRGYSFEDTVFKKGIHFIHLMIVSTITESRPTVDNFTVEDPVS